MMTTTVIMMTPVETTPTTTGTSHTVRHVTHTWWLKSSGGSDTE